MQSNQTKMDKLIINYFGKMKKESGVKSAAQFYQIEGCFLSVIRCTILENIPFIRRIG